MCAVLRGYVENRREKFRGWLRRPVRNFAFFGFKGALFFRHSFCGFVESQSLAPLSKSLFSRPFRKGQHKRSGKPFEKAPVGNIVQQLIVGENNGGGGGKTYLLVSRAAALLLKRVRYAAAFFQGGAGVFIKRGEHHREEREVVAQREPCENSVGAPQLFTKTAVHGFIFLEFSQLKFRTVGFNISEQSKADPLLKGVENILHLSAAKLIKKV